MDSHKFPSVFTALICLFPILCQAQPRLGASLHIPLLAKDPPYLRGYQILLSYDPDRFQWRQFNIFFDGGYSHFWAPQTDAHQNIHILSAAPVIRYHFKQRGLITPYLDLSIGVSYLDKTRFENRNLGMHFAFQDRLGVGILFGQQKQYSLGLTAIHYSNANLAPHNAGISIPLMLDLAYQVPYC